MPDSCQVHAPKYTHASVRSTVEKGLTGFNDIIIGKDNPGIGEYDTQHLQTIQNKELQGGCANNFSLFTRLKYQGRSPDIKVSPRLHKHLEPSKYSLYTVLYCNFGFNIYILIILCIIIAPRNVGPGTYLSKKNSLGGGSSGIAQNSTHANTFS